MPQPTAIKISRGVTVFPDDLTFHAEELTPPLDHPDASLIKVVIEGNTVTHWWQSSRPRVDGAVLRAAASGVAVGGGHG